MDHTRFSEPLSEHLWHTRIQWVEAGALRDASIEATWDRVALALASAEPHQQDLWRERFRGMLDDFCFLPSLQTLSSVGTQTPGALYSGFSMAAVEDSIAAIFNALRESMVTRQAGPGVGLNFSQLRPAGSCVAGGRRRAGGPVSFLPLWDAAHAVLAATDSPLDSVSISLRCDHPDIEAFINPPAMRQRLPRLQRTVLVSDTFMQAVEQNGPWPLVFPLGKRPLNDASEVCERTWSTDGPQPCLVHRRIAATALWDAMVQSLHEKSGLRLVFSDRIQRDDALWYGVPALWSDLCGLYPLPAHAGANSGAINLSRLVRNPLGAHPQLDLEKLRAVAALGVRFLDNIHTLSQFPLKPQEKMAHATRRIGLGITGLADMFLLLGLRYGAPASVTLVREIMRIVRETAYETSIELAREKGAFPNFDRIRHAAATQVLDLPRALQDAIAEQGLRNSHLLAVVPDPAMGLLANNISQGIAPVCAWQTSHTLPGADGQPLNFPVQDDALRHWHAVRGSDAPLPDYFVLANQVALEDQVDLAAAVQSEVDGAVNLCLYPAPDSTPQLLATALWRAWESGLRGGCSVA